ncbi:ECF RNA polymerase sigma factor SigW [compost metagenome]
MLKRRKNGWIKEMNAYLLSRPRLHNPVEEHVDQQEICLEFKKLYSRLPIKIRIVLTLRYENELSVPEISSVIGIPEGTVKSRLNRGVQLLQRLALTQLKEMIGNESI